VQRTSYLIGLAALVLVVSACSVDLEFRRGRPTGAHITVTSLEDFGDVTLDAHITVRSLEAGTSRSR